MVLRLPLLFAAVSAAELQKAEILWQELPWPETAIQRIQRRLKLEHGLDGSVDEMHLWECEEPLHCKKQMEEKAQVDANPAHTPEPSAAETKYKHCVESYDLEGLSHQIEVDLICYGFNVTCETMDTLRMKEDLFDHCDLDADMLEARCEFDCRSNRHPVRKCVYEFDKNNKYGMKKDPDETFDRCHMVADCKDEVTQVFGVYCNSTGFVRVVPADSNIAMILGVAVGIGFTAICCVAIFLLHRNREIKQEASRAATAGSGDVEVFSANHSNVVVGRPVEGNPAVASAAIPMEAASAAADAVGVKPDGVAAGAV